jgi:hypothetical protein
VQGDDKGEDHGMGAVESEARRLTRAADGSDVATGSMVLLIVQG